MEAKLKYEGYKGVALDRFDIQSLTTLKNVLIKNKFDFPDLEKRLEGLDKLTIDEIKLLAKDICAKYLRIHDIKTTTIDELQSHMPEISRSSTAYELYEKVNGILVPKSPFDLDIELVDSHAMFGLVEKPLIITPAGLEEVNRQMYFSKVQLSNSTNLISVGTYIHEIAHLEQESNIGYTDDYLNREIISIFLEKVVAQELDSTGELLRLCEQIRFAEMISRYSENFRNPNLEYNKKADNLCYIKSTLMATKLFDMYMQERKQKNKDKYFDDINDVFDGKQKVEDIIAKRNINIRQCQDQQLILRHTK